MEDPSPRRGSSANPWARFACLQPEWGTLLLHPGTCRSPFAFAKENDHVESHSSHCVPPLWRYRLAATPRCAGQEACRAARPVRPLYGIVSAGKDNSYHHPHKDVLERAEKFNIKILSTIELGTITFSTNGKRIKVLGLSEDLQVKKSE